MVAEYIILIGGLMVVGRFVYQVLQMAELLPGNYRDSNPVIDILFYGGGFGLALLGILTLV